MSYTTALMAVSILVAGIIGSVALSQSETPTLWTHASEEPVIGTLNRPRGETEELKQYPLTIWNDPSVMKKRRGYAMWASLGLKGGGSGVSIYILRSINGLNWRIANNGEPVLEPGEPGEFDWYGVETPSVIRVDGTYHMYYSVYHDINIDQPGGRKFTMGHATSTDGKNWTKLGELLSITSVVGTEGNHWGVLARAEPSIVHRNGLFLLYFTDVKCRLDDCSGFPKAVRGISLAASVDGHTFVDIGIEPVLLQTDSYPSELGWEGYSTPGAYYDGTHIQLYVDVFRHVEEHTWKQTRIAHYRSRSGLDFEEVEVDIVKVEGHPWATSSVRSPSVLEDGCELKMWYAGDNFTGVGTLEDILSGRLRLGIGLATKNNCE